MHGFEALLEQPVTRADADADARREHHLQALLRGQIPGCEEPTDAAGQPAE